MISKKDKDNLINIIKSIDVKTIDLENDNTAKQKWYRFGAYYAFRVVCDIIQALPEPAQRKKAEKIKSA